MIFSGHSSATEIKNCDKEWAAVRFWVKTSTSNKVASLFKTKFKFQIVVKITYSLFTEEKY